MLKPRIVWISLLVVDFSNVVSQTEVLKHLAKRGNKVSLIAMRSRTRQQQTSDSNMQLALIPIRYFPIISTFFGALSLIPYLPLYLATEKPNYIITNPDTSIFGFLLKLFKPFKFKVILDIRSTPLSIRGTFREYLNSFLFKMSIALAKKRFDGMTILTRLMKEEICSKFNINPEFVGVWTSGVSTEIFTSKGYDMNKIKTKLGLNGKFVVFHHGSISKARGIVETVKGIAMLKERHDDIVLFLLGTGTGLDELENLIRKYGVQDKVILHDWVDYEDVPKYIAMCDIAAVPLPDSPNWRHQCPLKLLEYLAMNKVVIVTDIPANREIIGDCECGIYISSIKPEAIAKAIDYAYSNREKLDEWGMHGRKIIEKSYSWEKIAEDFENYLLSIS